MQKGLTGKRPVKILDAANHTGVVSLLLFNNSGVNLYLGNDETSATTFNGIPILPNVLIPGMLWEGELWVGADVDNTEFRYQISNAISFNDAKQNRNLNVSITPQGFLSPKVLSCILLLFSLLGIPKIGKADQHFSATRQRDYFLVQAPWNQLSVGGVAGIKTFTINNLINTGQVILHIENFDTSSHSVTIQGVFCGLDPAIPDYDAATLTQQNNKFTILMLVQNGLSVTTGVLTAANQSAVTLLVNYVGCSSLHFRFSTADAVTTLVDVLYYINYQASAFTNTGGIVIGAMNQTVMQGLSLGSGTPTPLRVAGNGALPIVNCCGGGDSVSSVAQFLDQNGSSDLASQASYLFNNNTWDRQFYCPLTKFVSGVTATTSQIVALNGVTKIRICTIVIQRNDVAAVATTVKLVEGTGSNCGTGQTALTGNLFTSGATASTGNNQPTVINLGASGPVITNTPGDAVCVQTTGAASSFDVTITEVQY